MRFPAARSVRVAGTASRRPADLLGPAHRLPNAEALAALALRSPAQAAALAARPPTWPAQVFGVSSRDWATLPSGDPATCDVVDLGALAAEAALADAGIRADAVDLVIVATSTPSRPTQSDAHRLCKRLGVDAGAWDLRAGGASGLIGWAQAAHAVAAGARAAVVVAGEVPSPYAHPDDDVALALLYGDGVAAMVLAPGPGGLRCARTGHATVSGRAFTIEGHLPPRPGDTFRAVVPDDEYKRGLDAVWATASASLLEDLDGAPLDVLLPYAVTRAQVEAVSARIPARSVVTVLDDHACVGAGSPIAALDRWRRSGGRGTAGAVAVGGGVAWATLAFDVEDR